MTSKSAKLKKILKWAVALIGVAGLMVLGLIAWGLGVRWPTVHRVDQPGIPDFLHIKAVDFLDDSGYVVNLGFESCCTDRFVCKLSGAGKLFESKRYAITPETRMVSIPLRWNESSICPYKLTSVTLRFTPDRSSGATAIFDADEPWNSFPLTLNPDCFVENPVAEIADKCLDRAMFKFSLEMDTLQILRGEAK